MLLDDPMPGILEALDLAYAEGAAEERPYNALEPHPDSPLARYNERRRCEGRYRRRPEAAEVLARSDKPAVPDAWGPTYFARKAKNDPRMAGVNDEDARGVLGYLIVRGPASAEQIAAAYGMTYHWCRRLLADLTKMGKLTVSRLGGDAKWQARSGGLDERHPTRLNADDVRAIRRALAEGEEGKGLAHKYGVNPATISRIASGTTWGWLK